MGWILFRLRHFSRADLLLLIPIGAFVVLAVLHGRLIRAVNGCSRAIKFYEQGLLSRPGTRRAQKLKNGRSSEQIKITRVGMRRLQEMFAGSTFTRPAAIEPRQTLCRRSDNERG